MPWPNRSRPGGRKSLRWGVTLVELMIGAALLIPIALGLALFFGKTQQGLQYSKNKTNATFIANARLENLKALSYHRVRVASTTIAVPGVPVDALSRYDATHYPEEAQTRGGVNFKNYVFVEKVARNSGDVFVVLPSSAADTGTRRVNQTVVYEDSGGQRVLHYSNYLNRLYTANTAGQYFLTGTVIGTNTFPIEGAIVQDVQAPHYATRTDPAGNYRLAFDKERQNTTIWISSLPYQTQSFTQTVGPSIPLATQDATLSFYPRSTITMTAWRSTYPVIANVVARAMDFVDSTNSIEWVEVLNPTTYTITVAGRLGLRYQRAPGGNNGQDPAPINIDIQHITADLGPRRNYVFASTPTIRMAVTRSADAVWVATSVTNLANFANRRVGNAVFTSTLPNVITAYEDDYGTGVGDQREGAGSLQLYDLVTGDVYDTFGWAGGGGVPVSPGLFETAPYSGPVEGLRHGYAFRRFVSTEGIVGGLAAFNHNWIGGPPAGYDNCNAYDTNNNAVNWGEQSLQPGGQNVYPVNASGGGCNWLRSGVPWPGTTLWWFDRFFNYSTYTATMVTLPNGMEYAGVTIQSDAQTTFNHPKYIIGEKDGVWGWTEFQFGGGAFPLRPFNPTTPFVSLRNPDPNVLSGPQGHQSLPRWIRGKVLNQNGVPFTGAVYVSMTSTIYPPGYAPRPTMANPSTGEYMLFVPVSADNSGVNIGRLWAWQGFFDFNGNWMQNPTPTANHTLTLFDHSGLPTAYSNVNITANEGGGWIRGFVTTDGVAPVQGVKVKVTNTTGGGTKTVYSDESGLFYSDFLSTGTYAVEPQMASGEFCVPSSVTVLATAVVDYFSSTFTYGSPYGSLSGTVTDTSLPSVAGALIVVSTYSTAAASLLTLDSSLRNSGLNYHMTTTDEQGRYNVRVRAGTPFYVHCFHRRLVGSVLTSVSATAGPYTLGMGASQGGVDFAW